MASTILFLGLVIELIGWLLMIWDLLGKTKNLEEWFNNNIEFLIKLFKVFTIAALCITTTIAFIGGYIVPSPKYHWRESYPGLDDLALNYLIFAFVAFGISLAILAILTLLKVLKNHPS